MYLAPGVEIIILLFKFTCVAVGFGYVHIAPVSDMAVLSCFVGRYENLHNRYNWFILLHVNVFMPP